MSNRYDDIFQQMEREMDRMTSDALQHFDRLRGRSRFWQPRADICETEECILITVELAGLSAEAVSKRINVTLSPDNRTLTISGRRGEQCEGNRLRCFQLEIYYGEFERTLILPEVPVQRDNLSASYRDGLLTITLPKRPPEEPRSIPVTGSSD